MTNTPLEIQEITPPLPEKRKKSPLRRAIKIGLVAFLSVLCIVGIVLMYHIHNQLSPVKVPTLMHVQPIAMAPKIDTSIIKISEKPAVAPAKIAAKKEVAPKKIESSVIDPIIIRQNPQIIKTLKKSPISDNNTGFSMQSALALNDAFLNQQSCTVLYQQLKESPDKTASLYL